MTMPVRIENIAQNIMKRYHWLLTQIAIGIIHKPIKETNCNERKSVYIIFDLNLKKKELTA